MKEMQNGQFGFVWYKPEQWDRLRAVSKDVDQLESDYVSWCHKAQDTMLQMQIDGVNVERVIVDIDEIIEWGRDNGLRINSGTRA